MACHLVEVVRREVEWSCQSKPSTGRPDDGVDVFLLFLGRVGVVEAQVAGAAVDLGRPKLRQMLLAWPVVQVAVGLGREAVSTRPPQFAGRRSSSMRLVDEVGGGGVGRGGQCGHLGLTLAGWGGLPANSK